MLFTLFSVALFVAASIRGVAADFAVNSPHVYQCQNITISWEPTDAPPYNLIVASGTDMCGEPLREVVDNFYGTITQWVADLELGTPLYFSVMDSQDREAWSGNLTVEAGSGNSCLSPSSAGSPASGSPGGSTPSDSPAPSPSPSGSNISPLGAANAGKFSGAVTVRQASLPIVAFAGLAVVVALL